MLETYFNLFVSCWLYLINNRIWIESLIRCSTWSNRRYLAFFYQIWKSILFIEHNLILCPVEHYLFYLNSELLRLFKVFTIQSSKWMEILTIHVIKILKYQNLFIEHQKSYISTNNQQPTPDLQRRGSLLFDWLSDVVIKHC